MVHLPIFNCYQGYFQNIAWNTCFDYDHILSAIFYYSCLTLRNRKKNSHQRTKLICLGTILDSRWISSVNLWRQKMSSLSTPATTLPTLPTPPTPILHLTTTKGMTDTIDLTDLIGNNFPEQKKQLSKRGFIELYSKKHPKRRFAIYRKKLWIDYYSFVDTKRFDIKVVNFYKQKPIILCKCIFE